MAPPLTTLFSKKHKFELAKGVRKLGVIRCHVLKSIREKKYEIYKKKECVNSDDGSDHVSGCVLCRLNNG